mgnify:CR=1 FL=1
MRLPAVVAGSRLYLTYEGLKQCSIAGSSVAITRLYLTYEGLKPFLKEKIFVCRFVVCILPMRD